MDQEKNPGVLINAKKRKVWPWLIMAFMIIVGLFLYLGGYEAMKEFYSRYTKSRQAYFALKKAEKYLTDYQETLRQDNFGGKTPKETLDMFISALEKGDLDLAVKYFAYDDNLSREEWSKALKEKSDQGKIPEIINALKKAVDSPDQPGYDSAHQFIILDKNKIQAIIFMELNEQSKVWKIKSI